MSRNLSSFIIFISMIVAAHSSPDMKKLHQPCRRLVFYFHDILYNGTNRENSTSVIVGQPAWGNKFHLARPLRYGDIVVFDNPITLDTNLHSPPVGRAQGFYLYDSKETLNAWLSFSIAFNSTNLQGTINFAGNDRILDDTRDLSVIGGTGDFFMARGIATLMTDSYEDENYFRLRVDIKLFECWEN